MTTTRRKLLHSGGTALLVSLAGCLFKDAPSETRLNLISILNQDNEPHTINILLMEENEPVYWSSVEVESFDENENRLGGMDLKNIPTSPGHYVLYAWKNNQPRSEWEKQDLSEFNSSCVDILIMIDDRSEVSRGNIDIKVSANCPDGSA